MVDVSRSLRPGTRVYVAGHRGLAGSAIWRRLQRKQGLDLVGWSSSELDLRDRDGALSAIEEARPDVVVLAAAHVGGILANARHPTRFLSDNLQIQVNVMDAAARSAVQRLVFLGSSCIYPRMASQPIAESSLMTGALEETNEAYAVAKIAGIAQVRAVRREYGWQWVSVMPTNLYGPGDNFDLETAHVLPALIHRLADAKRSGADSITLWGSGGPRREFLHVDDLADAIAVVLESYDGDEPINVGVGADITIRDLAALVAHVVGYQGVIEWDLSKPDGTPRKLLDVSRMRALGWRAQIDLEAGIRATYEWYGRIGHGDALPSPPVS